MSAAALALLKSIDASLKALLAHANPSAVVAIASDDELDGQYGDPEVKFSPRDWRGDSYKGAAFSQCPAELLDLLANAYDYFAKKNDDSGATDSKGRPKSHWDRKSAALARGWAKRIRAGWTAPGSEIVDEPTAAPFDPGVSEWPADEEIPF